MIELVRPHHHWMFENIDQRICWVRYVRLANNIVPRTLEQFMLGIAFFSGFKKANGIIPIIQEKVHYSKDIVNEMIRVIWKINKDSHFEMVFPINPTVYWINYENAKRGKC
jgi:hypothetical protein